MSRGRLPSVSRAIVDAGGSIVRSHPRAGVLIASGLSAEAAAALAGFPGVELMAADAMIHFSPAPAMRRLETLPLAHDPTEAVFYQRGLQWNMEVIRADDAWRSGASAEGVTVAILDSGIDATHVDLQGLVDAGRSIAFVENANPAIPPWGDDHWHGTHVAGTVASNGLGTAGVAPHATLMAVKICTVFDGCPFSALFSGIIHAAENGADVINLSIGGFYAKSDPGGGRLHSLLNRVVNYANSRGVVVVSGAGNDGIDLQHVTRDHDGPYVFNPCENGVGLCVSATNVHDEPTVYTNYGKSVINLAAPGGDDDIPVLAPCSTQSVLLPMFGLTCTPREFIWAFGTSMATPHVSGAAALVRAGGVSSPGAVRTTLMRAADDLGKAGADPYYGAGRLNVLRAVER